MHRRVQRLVGVLSSQARAAAAWFDDLGLASDKPRYIEIALDVASRPALAFVPGRDDHHLIDDVPTLPKIRRLVHELEKKHRVAFQRDQAFIRTNITAGKTAVSKWLETV